MNLFGWVGVEMPPPTEIWSDGLDRGEGNLSDPGMGALEMFMAWLACVQVLARVRKVDGVLKMVVGWSEIQLQFPPLHMCCMPPHPGLYVPRVGVNYGNWDP